MNHHLALAIALLTSLSAACDYEAPLSPDATDASATLEGTVVVHGVDEPSHTFLMLFDAADPPPPQGMGQPVSLTSVPAEAFYTDAGLLSAPFTFSEVKGGEWLIFAFMDQDADFQPVLSATSGVTCGDQVGGHLQSLSGATLAPIPVEYGDYVESLPVVLLAEMSMERPAFTVSSSSIDPGSSEAQLFTLSSTPIWSELMEITGPFDGSDPCDTALFAMTVDQDGDGEPDAHSDPDYAAMGALDAWPKVYVQYTGVGDVELEEGERWVSEAIVDPAALAALVPGSPAPLSTLDAIFVPAAQHTLPDGSSEVVMGDLPAGTWSITVVQMSGQTWTVPNELPEFSSTDSSFDPTLQGLGLQVL